MSLSEMAAGFEGSRLWVLVWAWAHDKKDISTLLSFHFICD